MLFRSGANPNAENLSKVTPLTLAKDIANYDVAKFFEG